MIISQIVAVSENHVIGRNNRMPWKVPADASYFHRVTLGHVVLTGRKNYQANGRALPGRLNMVISRDPGFSPADALRVSSPAEGIRMAEDLGEEELFIIGGGEIYALTLPETDRIYLTIIHTVLAGDVYYPPLEEGKWQLVSKINREKDKENPFDQTYLIFERAK
ncbi:MAG: dihydrofolate reductase [Bacteroidota bacterium]